MSELKIVHVLTIDVVLKLFKPVVQAQGRTDGHKIFFHKVALLESSR
jgi:hypothetical protein